MGIGEAAFGLISEPGKLLMQDECGKYLQMLLIFIIRLRERET